MRWILAEILGIGYTTTTVPHTYLYQFHELVFEVGNLIWCCLLHGEETVAILTHALGIEPEIVIGYGTHVQQGELFLLRQIGAELHIVCRPMVGNKQLHEGLQ